MTGSHLPLNALRAFEASARHLSFTQAGLELRVSQAAISHQVNGLEKILGVRLFRRLPRGLALTDEGQALVPVLAESFRRMRGALDQFEDGRFREVVTVGVVGTFATGWLLPRLPAFHQDHPSVDLRVLTNNNRVDLAGEGLDYAIRFGDGSWHGADATPLIAARLSPVCAPEIAERLTGPADLGREVLLCGPIAPTSGADGSPRSAWPAPRCAGRFSISVWWRWPMHSGAGPGRGPAAGRHVHPRAGTGQPGAPVRAGRRRRPILARRARSPKAQTADMGLFRRLAPWRRRRRGVKTTEHQWAAATPNA